jgi:hypothetical protein
LKATPTASGSPLRGAALSEENNDAHDRNPGSASTPSGYGIKELLRQRTKRQTPHQQLQSLNSPTATTGGINRRFGK